MIIIGIDPGLTGAVAVLNDGIAQVYDVPILTVHKGSKGGIRHEFDENAMAGLIQGIIQFGPVCVAAVERVHSMPEQGAASGFSFGMGFGIWRGILAALAIPRDYVTPQAWKKAMLNGMGKDKDASLIRAKELFPSVDLSLRKHDGRADALLIAEFRRRMG